MSISPERVMSGTAAVVFDRDGVLNRPLIRGRKPYAPTRLEEFKILPEAVEAASNLKKAGFKLIVATNQPDASAGQTSRSEVEAMHSLLNQRLALDGIYVCYHVDAHNCDCRKPKPGMLLTAAREHNFDLRNSYMVGDRWRDVLAGKTAGCHTILIDYDYDEPMPIEPDFVVTNIGEATERILSEVSN